MLVGDSEKMKQQITNEDQLPDPSTIFIIFIYKPISMKFCKNIFIWILLEYQDKIKKFHKWRAPPSLSPKI